MRYFINLRRRYCIVTVATLTLCLCQINLNAADLPVAGVVEFTTSAQNISCEGWKENCNDYLAEGFRTMVETAIVKTKRMTVMERTRMNTLLQEQVISESGLVEDGPSLGGLHGVDYIVYGAITKFGKSTSGVQINSNRGIGSLLNREARQAADGGLSTTKTSVEMEIDMKITDVQTSEIVVADYVGATVQTGQAFSVGGITSGGENADPFAGVQRVLASKIAEAVVTSKYPVKVARVQGDGTIILNYGNVFFAPGDQLIAFEVGEEFVDPDTGIILGAEETEVGRIEIVSSAANISRARLLGDPTDIPVGSVLKRAKEKTKEAKKKRGGRW